MRTLDGPRWGPKAGGTPHALVVLCHGLGASGQDLIDLGPGWGDALPHAMFVAPDAPEPYPGVPFGRQWFDFGDFAVARLAAGMAAAGADLLGFIEAELARLKLPADAVALMGFSQGAMTALYAGLHRRVPPRAILAYSGAMLERELPRRAPLPPVLLVHGAADEVVPASRSADAERVLRAAGLPVELLIVPRLGHGIDPQGLSAGALFLQRAFADAASEDAPPTSGT
jgi:phospholipase/carboxylesterase